MTLVQFAVMVSVTIAAVVALFAHEIEAAAFLMGFSGMMLFLSEGKR